MDLPFEIKEIILNLLFTDDLILRFQKKCVCGYISEKSKYLNIYKKFQFTTKCGRFNHYSPEGIILKKYFLKLKYNEKLNIFLILNK